MFLVLFACSAFDLTVFYLYAFILEVYAFKNVLAVGDNECFWSWFACLTFFKYIYIYIINKRDY